MSLARRLAVLMAAAWFIAAPASAQAPDSELALAEASWREDAARMALLRIERQAQVDAARAALARAPLAQSPANAPTIPNHVYVEALRPRITVRPLTPAEEQTLAVLLKPVPKSQWLESAIRGRPKRPPLPPLAPLLPLAQTGDKRAMEAVVTKYIDDGYATALGPFRPQDTYATSLTLAAIWAAHYNVLHGPTPTTSRVWIGFNCSSTYRPERKDPPGMRVFLYRSSQKDCGFEMAQPLPGRALPWALWEHEILSPEEILMVEFEKSLEAKRGGGDGEMNHDTYWRHLGQDPGRRARHAVASRQGAPIMAANRALVAGAQARLEQMMKDEQWKRDMHARIDAAGNAGAAGGAAPYDPAATVNGIISRNNAVNAANCARASQGASIGCNR